MWVGGGHVNEDTAWGEAAKGAVGWIEGGGADVGGEANNEEDDICNRGGCHHLGMTRPGRWPAARAGSCGGLAWLGLGAAARLGRGGPYAVAVWLPGQRSSKTGRTGETEKCVTLRKEENERTRAGPKLSQRVKRWVETFTKLLKFKEMAK